MKKLKLSKVIFLLCLSVLPYYSRGQYAMEKLNRGVVSVRSGNNNFVSWRWLGTEDNITFNLYRNGAKVNTTPLTVTNYTDNGAPANAQYYVKAVVGGVEQAASETVATWGQNYLSVPLQVPNGNGYTYSANDCSVADVDGDGIYEILLKWDPSNSKDNSQSGVTGNVLIDCYKLNGTRLWRIDLGRNIRAGAHYTQMAFFDFDGDGKAEFMCKTADATIDGTGKVIGNASADYRNSSGYVLSGPEFLTVFNGLTGAAMATTNYIPARGTVSSWGDSYGNRVDRFRVGVAYLDGKRPTAIFCRGYYTRLVMAAWDWRDGKLTNRWTFDSNNSGNSGYAGQGDHSLSVADVDNDGKQEIISGAAVLDDSGTPYFTTGFGHGDALHVSDLDPSVPGLEVVNIQERFDKQGLYMYSATGKKVIWTIPSVQAGSDGEGPARGVSGDITAASPGAESWAAGAGVTGLYNTKGQKTGLPTPSSCNFLSWWDGDLLRELLDKTSISKYQGSTLLSASGCASNNGTKSTPCLSGDILGDWREEVIFRTSDSKALRVYTTTIPTSYKIRTLLHDPQYRVALAWQNGAYNQPPHVGFFLGDKMPEPARPNITIVGAQNPVNQAPVVSLAAPANNASYTAPASITISANASDADGTISSVSFYNGATLLGTDASAPYSYDWTNVGAGTYTITAKATDNSGAAATSDAITVKVSTIPVGNFTLQGEAACSVNGILNENTNTGFHGAGYANLTNAVGTKANYAVSASVAGNVGLTIRFANGTTAARSMSVSVNGTTQVASVSFPGTGAWTTWNTAVVQLYLAQGNNIITLTSLTADGGPNIDELVFNADNITAGTCTTNNVTIQGEAACSADGVLNENTNTGFHGTGYVNVNNAVGSKASWTVSANAPGNAGLTIRFANGTTVTRSMSVSVNGTTQIASVSFAATGAWTTWSTTVVQLSVAQGNNIITLTSLTADGGPNIDELVFSSDNIAAGTCTANALNAAASAPEAAKVLVGPNPSEKNFTLTAIEGIESITVANANGIEVFRNGRIAQDEQIQFGSGFDAGVYSVTVVYSSGEVEVLRLQKL